MRIANNTIVGNYLAGLNGTNSQYAKTIEQSDGSKLHRASDNDVGYAKYLRYQNDLTDNEQMTNNIKTALSWMKASDATLVNITGLLKTFEGKVVKTANSDNNASDMKDIAKELMAIIQEVIADLNSRVEDRYIFGGQADTTLPYSFSDSTIPRVEAVTLNDNQAAFFNRVSTGSVTQMLKLNGSDGKNYYYDTATGDLFTENFVKEGYKDVVASGRTNFNRELDRGPDKMIGTIPMVGVSTASGYSITGTIALSDERQKEFFGTDALYVVKNGTVTYYADAAGRMYKPDFVTSDWKTAREAGQSRVLPRDANPYNIHQVGYYDVPEGSTAENIFGAGTRLNEITYAGVSYYEDAAHYIYDKNDVENIPAGITTLAEMQTSVAKGNVNDIISTWPTPEVIVQSFTYQEDRQLNADQKKYFGTDVLQKVEGNDSGVYYRNSATNQVYTADFVDNGYKTSGHPTVIPADAAYTSKNLLNLNVNASGLIINPDGGVVSNIPGLSFTISTYEQSMVQYNGDLKYVSMPNQIGLSNPEKDSVNANGQDIFGMDIFETGDAKATGAALVNDLLTVVHKIEDGDYNWLSSEGITIADKAHATVVKAQTKLATRQKSYEDVASMLTTQNKRITGDITDVSSADIGELATELMAYNKAYNLSLNIGARVLPMSLLDYLR